MPTSNDGVMIILSSPSGAGKTTLVSLLSELDNFEISISHTTRQPRINEKPDKDYYFVNEEEFGSEISDSEAEKILTVGDAVKFIEGKAN